VADTACFTLGIASPDIIGPDTAGPLAPVVCKISCKCQMGW